MHPLLPLLALPTTLPASTLTKTLTFDHLPPALHLAPLPTPFTHLTFTPTFSLFAPSSPHLIPYLTPHDRNCAPSAPNALLGSRAHEGGPGAGFQIANATRMREEEGLEGWFELVGMRVKPLEAPPGGVKVWVKGFRRKDGDGEGEEVEEERWEVVFPSGYYEVFDVEMGRVSKGWWGGLWRVEMGADFGRDGLDWEFCLDDLRVGFTEIGEQEGGVEGRRHDGL